MKKTLILLAAGLLAGGCLTRQNHHTLYLDPDGSAVWSVFEQEVRSDAQDPQDRAREERAMLEAVWSGHGAAAEALHGLGGRRVDSRVVREERPFAVYTEARFDSIADALRRFFDDLGLDSSVELQARDSRIYLTFGYREQDDPEVDDERQARAGALLDDPERYRFVLTAGAFVEADGFRLEAGDTAAVLLARSEEEVDASGGYARYTLVWPAPPAGFDR